jgi:hypothetical protein
MRQYYNKGKKVEKKKSGKKFPDLTGDGKVTRADVLKGRGVFKRGGDVSERTSSKEKKSNIDYSRLNPYKLKKMGGGMIRKTFRKGGDTHVTKDGRTVKKGLYYYMNRAKKAGKSRPGKGTVTDKALKQSAKTAKK